MLEFFYQVLSMTMFKGARAKEAVRICGFETVAMLDYLERSGIFSREPTKRHKGRGRFRLYSFRDLIVLKVIKTLLDNGASVAALKRSLAEFQNEKWRADQATLEDARGAIRFLAVSQGAVLFPRSTDEIYDLTRNGQMLFAFMLDLDRIHTEICNEVLQRPLAL